MIVNLSEIKDIKSIEELSKHYNLMRVYCHNINNKQREQMDDILQDVFIKLHKLFDKYPSKVIDGGYVAMTIKSVYYNYLKAYNNKMDFGTKLYEPIIPDSEDDSIFEIEKKVIEEVTWIEYDNIVNEFSWYDRKVHEYSMVMSLSEFSRKSGIGYNSLRHTIMKNKIKLKTINR